MSKEEWCDKYYSYSATYDIHIFRCVIYDFCVRLQYHEKSTMNKSGSSSSLWKKSWRNTTKSDSKKIFNFFVKKINDSSSELNNDSSVNDCDFDEYSSNSKHYLSYSDFYVRSYQFEIDCNH